MADRPAGVPSDSVPVLHPLRQGENPPRSNQLAVQGVRNQEDQEKGEEGPWFWGRSAPCLLQGDRVPHSSSHHLLLPTTQPLTVAWHFSLYKSLLAPIEWKG